MAQRNPFSPAARAGLLSRMEQDGCRTFSDKVRWVEGHMPNIDDPASFVGALVKRQNPPDAGYNVNLDGGESAFAKVYGREDPYKAFYTHGSKAIDRGPDAVEALVAKQVRAGREGWGDPESVDASKVIILLAREKLRGDKKALAYLPDIKFVRVDQTNPKQPELVFAMPAYQVMEGLPRALKPDLAREIKNCLHVFETGQGTLAQAAQRFATCARGKGIPQLSAEVPVIVKVLQTLDDIAKSLPLTKNRADMHEGNLAIDKDGHLIILDPMVAECKFDTVVELLKQHQPKGKKNPEGSVREQVAELERVLESSGAQVNLSASSIGSGVPIVELAKLVIPKGQRERGLGSAVMQQLCDAADAHGWMLVTTPSTDFGGSKTRLTEFYARFGFVPNKGKHKDFTTRATMLRPVSKKNPPQPELFQGMTKVTVTKGKFKDRPEYADEAINLIQTAYAPIGGHANMRTREDLLADDADVYRFEDIDSDLEPDVLQVSKTTPYGLKTVAMGHDGTKEAKRKAVEDKIEDFRTFGNYGEVSGALAKRVLTAGVPVVGDQRLVEKILNKKVNWVGTDPDFPNVYGWYERMLAGHMHRKILVGLPESGTKNPRRHAPPMSPQQIRAEIATWDEVLASRLCSAAEHAEAVKRLQALLRRREK